MTMCAATLSLCAVRRLRRRAFRLFLRGRGWSGVQRGLVCGSARPRLSGGSSNSAKGLWGSDPAKGRKCRPASPDHNRSPDDRCFRKTSGSGGVGGPVGASLRAMFGCTQPARQNANHLMGQNHAGLFPDLAAGIGRSDILSPDNVGPGHGILKMLTRHLVPFLHIGCADSLVKEGSNRLLRETA
jgi:hypothetical protein